MKSNHLSAFRGKDKSETARALVAAHYQKDDQMRIARIFLSEQDDIIRLLEVTDAVPHSGVLSPFSFAPARQYGVDFPSSVILVNSRDWKAIVAGKLKLPQDWNLQSSEEVKRQVVVAS